MFQYSLNHADGADASENLAKAVDKGITWIELAENAPELLVDEAERLCRDKGLILTVTDDIELLNNRRFHGILLTREPERVNYIREELGGHPIVGVLLKPGDEYLWLRPLDIDFIALDAEGNNEAEAADYARAINNKWPIPVVARLAHIDSDISERILSEGFRGICLTGGSALDRFTLGTKN